MNNLISKKALIKKLFFSEDNKKYPMRDVDNFQITITMEELRKIISDQPTAYDVEKVVEQLTKASYEHYDLANCVQLDFAEAIEIVKGGGIDE